MTTWALSVNGNESHLEWESDTLGTALLRAAGIAASGSSALVVEVENDTAGDPASFDALCLVSPAPVPEEGSHE